MHEGKEIYKDKLALCGKNVRLTVFKQECLPYITIYYVLLDDCSLDPMYGQVMIYAGSEFSHLAN